MSKVNGFAQDEYETLGDKFMAGTIDETTFRLGLTVLGFLPEEIEEHVFVAKELMDD